MLVVTALAFTGCGGGKTYANKPRPATPVNLTVYINNARVSASPASVGAGEVVFIITNQASRTTSLTIHASGNIAQALADSGPINPQGTDQVTVDFRSPGDYVLSAAAGSSSDASSASIAPATVHVGRPRASSSGQLMQP
jgi:hypothetical protein